MPIRKLSTLLINQIAAGEVIERPASVVKELVENSLDAGATRIDLAIEEGGTQLVRVSDNGSGIAADELPLAVAPHATSKLQTPDQLAAVATLGFRGEALASIASVSRLRIASRATNADGQLAEAGAVIESSGDELTPVTPTACGAGTVIEIRDLFFNTPARRKFMRAAPVEFGHIAEIVSRIAMGRPDVGFSMTHNGRKTLEVLAGQSKRQRCVEILGKELDEALMEYDSAGPLASSSASPITVWGLAGQPSIARATAKFQYLYVNGRPIRDRSLTHALREAYRGLIPPDRQPVAVAFIWMDPGAVDVNVHPTKAEVRFLEPSRVHGAVLTAVRQCLSAADLTPRTSIPFSDMRLPTIGAANDSDGTLGFADATPTPTSMQMPPNHTGNGGGFTGA
ncbi:MAG: DNA mismatch repair endonuclease MutL, partial [Planctomycetota bacterium]|nr:DNA mismatch repair endonuclease MutL [Planctomycetota bacterium]